MKVIIALFFVILTAEQIAYAAPINNSTELVQKIVQVQPEQVNEVQPIIQAPVSETPKPVEKERPKPVTATVTNTPITGSKEEWLRLAEIPETEWGYVDYIVSKESSWNPNAVNKSSGACGLAQALPCSKLGTNWSDPVHALKWQHQYVTDRYGGYAQAYTFWKNNNWY